MGIAAFNRMRRVAAQQAAAAKPEKQPKPSLLEALNGATDEKTLSELPGVGMATGRVLLANRPEGGYGSVEDAIAANKKLEKRPYNLDWQKLQDHFVEVN